MAGFMLMAANLDVTQTKEKNKSLTLTESRDRF
jgi:hypothetical protein